MADRTESQGTAPKGAATERNAQVVDADALFAAVKGSGMRSPVFLDGYRVSFPEAEVMRLAERLSAVAELVGKAEKVAGWLGAQAAAAERRAQDTRFPSLAEANAADAQNYRAIADDLRAALAPFQTGGAE